MKWPSGINVMRRQFYVSVIHLYFNFELVLVDSLKFNGFAWYRLVSDYRCAACIHSVQQIARILEAAIEDKG